MQFARPQFKIRDLLAATFVVAAAMGLMGYLAPGRPMIMLAVGVVCGVSMGLMGLACMLPGRAGVLVRLGTLTCIMIGSIGLAFWLRNR